MSEIQLSPDSRLAYRPRWANAEKPPERALDQRLAREIRKAKSSCEVGAWVTPALLQSLEGVEG